MSYVIASKDSPRKKSLSHLDDIKLSSSTKQIGASPPHVYKVDKSMTPGAQQALRRTMEIYAGTTRFALACNQSNKIIEAIQSRCAIVRYSRLTDQQVLTRLLQICQAENVTHTEDGLAALIFSAEGDMRQAINNLQSTVAGFGLVNGENVFKVCDQPHPIAVQNMLRECLNGKVEEALETLRDLWGKGYSAVDIISTMFRVVKTMDSLQEYTKLEFIKVASCSL